MRRQFMGFAALAAMMASIGFAQTSPSSPKAVIQAHADRRGRRSIPGTGGGSPFKHRRTPPKNQQQRRELLRRMPHLRKAKNCPL